MSKQLPSKQIEDLKDENNFIKMKLMLEKGAKFGSSKGAPPMPPEIENMFLKNVLAFDKIYEGCDQISIFEKVGNPGPFVAPDLLNDTEVETAWNEVRKLLAKNSIELMACSPNATPRDLYQFATTEFMKIMVDDVDMPGYTLHFYYDDFHPDPYYESSRIAIVDCMSQLFNTRIFDESCFFSWFDLQLNEHTGMMLYQFGEKINNFKQAYDDIKIVSLNKTACEVNGNCSVVSGNYTLELKIDEELQVVSGNWSVTLECKECLLFWYVNKVMVEGIKF